MSVTPRTRLTRYLTVVLRWLLIIGVTFVLSYTAGQVLIDHLFTQIYTASATIQVPASDLVVPTAGPSPEPVPFQPEFENVIRAPDFLLSIIKDLGLDKAWAKRANPADEDAVPDIDALTIMEKVLTFQPDAKTNTVQITASSEVPVEAAQIANAVADRYKMVCDIEVDHTNPHGIVKTLTRAETPTVPTHPNRSFSFMVLVVLASILSIIAASFVEIILLFLRAGDRVDN